MEKLPLKAIFTNWKVVLFVLFLLFSLISIKPQVLGNQGVIIASVIDDSAAALGGIANPKPELPPLARETVTSINGQSVAGVEQYNSIVSSLFANQTVKVETDSGVYTLITTEDASLGLRVADAPLSNLRKGLDLAGGTRVLLEPAEQVSEEDLELVKENLQERLNVYGLSDVIVRIASDLSGAKFILVEMAGVTEEEVKALLSSQGKFEAKIANQTILSGGKQDVTYVCRSAECSGIDPYQGCSSSDGTHYCSFFFSITVQPEAAERMADATRDLTIVEGNYLSEDIVLFLDDQEFDSLRIGASLRGRPTTNIQISGSGEGRSPQEAIDNTLLEMKRLQTVIATGSLPVKLNIVKLDTISPSLGKEFLDNMLLVFALVIATVVAVVLIRYRTLKVAIPMVATMLGEIVLILGFASFAGWNLDLAAIAGIIIVAGTGVDHLIVITDETLRGEASGDWKRRLKNAMFIVIGAYFTTVAGMLPLWWAGAGLLKGFALTTIAGISFGVFIARPAFAVMIEKLLA